jgi:eukaryotic-like serine/threonine-protein kinase
MSHEEGHVLAGRYRLEERIAVGGMGEVWRAHDDTLDREVAVKLLRPESTSDDTFVERFRAEARHAGGLTHPNVGTVHDYGEDGGNAYLVMELLEGQPLSDIIRERAPMDPAEVTEILHQTAIALQAAHEAGVVHRDVKPANIVVDADGYAKITDFGIARALGEAPMTQTGEVLGTPHYLAPEQAKGQPAGPLSDVYALAVVGYEMLTGRRPFSGDSMVTTALAHVNQPLPPLPDTVPEPLRTTVMAALAKSPQQRPGGAGAFADALRLPAGEVPADLEHGAASAVAPVVVGGPAGQAEPAQVDSSATSVLPTPTPGFPEPAPPAVVAADAGVSTTQRRGAGRPAWVLPAAAAAVVVLVVAIALVLGNRGRADTTGTQPHGIPASSSSTTITRPATTTRTTTTATTGAGVAPAPAQASAPAPSQHAANGKAGNGGKGSGKAKGGKHK